MTDPDPTPIARAKTTAEEFAESLRRVIELLNQTIVNTAESIAEFAEAFRGVHVCEECALVDELLSGLFPDEGEFLGCHTCRPDLDLDSPDMIGLIKANPHLLNSQLEDRTPDA